MTIYWVMDNNFFFAIYFSVFYVRSSFIPHHSSFFLVLTGSIKKFVHNKSSARRLCFKFSCSKQYFKLLISNYSRNWKTNLLMSPFSPCNMWHNQNAKSKTELFIALDALLIMLLLHYISCILENNNKMRNLSSTWFCWIACCFGSFCCCLLSFPCSSSFASNSIQISRQIKCTTRKQYKLLWLQSIYHKKNENISICVQCFTYAKRQ